jgi:hypothetical protein
MIRYETEQTIRSHSRLHFLEAPLKLGVCVVGKSLRFSF